MGYYTKYNLEWDDDSFEIPADFEGLNYAFDEEGYYVDSVKWYDYNTDMLNLSETYPNVLFTLTGVGEDDDDRWVAYYKYGKVQKEQAKISFDPFDEIKLK